MPSLPRVLLPLALAGAALSLGVATLVAPPHPTAEAAPPPDSEIPTTLVCRSGGAMRLELGPRFHMLHYKLRPGLGPKSTRDILPGECASGADDIPLGSATVPALRILAHPTGMNPNFGLAISVNAKGVGASLAGVSQCDAADRSLDCQLTEYDKQHLADLEQFGRVFQTEGQLFQFRVFRDQWRPLAPYSTLMQYDFWFPSER